MGASNDGRGPIVGINVTPLVDITLVLLIIFIVTAKIVVTPALPLDLPHAAESEAVQVVFSIVLQENGAIFVDGTRTESHEALLENARAAIAEHPELRAVIQAESAVHHAQVMEILDLLKSVGIDRVAFATIAERP